MYNEIYIKEVKNRTISVNKLVNNKWNGIIQEFTEAMSEKNQSSDFYVKNRNANSKNVSNNIFLGKKGELFAASALLKYHKFPKIKLDFDIRTGGNKGWDCDLPYSNTFGDVFPNVHVKTCDQKTFNMIGDYTWTFQNGNLQNNNKSGKDDVFANKTNSDLVILVYMDDMLSHKATIKAILPFNELRFHFKDPKFSKFKGLKKCIYYEDLEKMNLPNTLEHITLENAISVVLKKQEKNPYQFLKTGFKY